MVEGKFRYVKEIIIGVLSSTIFLIFIQPILNLIWDFLRISSFSTYQLISSKIIKQAALGEVNYSDLFFMVGLQGFFLIAFIKIFNHFEMLIKKQKTLDELNVETKNNLDNSKPKINFETTKKSPVKRLTYIKYFFIVYFVFAFLWGIFLSSMIIIPKGLIAEFNQKTNIISPYIADQKLKELKSQWALMKNIQDFNKISLQLKTISGSLKINLPKSVYF